MSSPKIGIQAVQFGQEYRDADGIIQIASEDMVLQTVYIDDQPRFSIDLAPENAMDAAHAMMRAAARLVQARITNDGKPASILNTFATIAKSGRHL